jgi:hypothetical protein
MKSFGGPKISQWEGVIQKDLEKDKNNSEFTEATQNTQDGSSRQRKGKNSKFQKFNENDMIMKSASQYF